MQEHCLNAEYWSVGWEDLCHMMAYIGTVSFHFSDFANLQYIAVCAFDVSGRPLGGRLRITPVRPPVCPMPVPFTEHANTPLYHRAVRKTENWFGFGF